MFSQLGHATISSYLPAMSHTEHAMYVSWQVLVSTAWQETPARFLSCFEVVWLRLEQMSRCFCRSNHFSAGVGSRAFGALAVLECRGGVFMNPRPLPRPLVR